MLKSKERNKTYPKLALHNPIAGQKNKFFEPYYIVISEGNK